MEADSEKIQQRYNPHCSMLFCKACCIAVVVFVILLSSVEATNTCTERQFSVESADGVTLCEDCGDCPPGRGLSHKCGKHILPDAMVKCIPCQSGVSFSSAYDSSTCTPCASCSEDQVVLQNCTPTKNIKCAKQCYSKDRYYNDSGDCKKCSKCCGDGRDVVEDECKQKLGAASNMICSFHSSVNRCGIATTASPQNITTITGINTSTYTKASPSGTHQETLISTPYGPGSPHLSEQKHLDIPLVVTVPVVIVGLLLVIAGCVAYFLCSRKRCSYLSQMCCCDAEMGVDHRSSDDPLSSCAGVAMVTEGEKVMLEGLPAESSEPLLKSKEPENLTCSFHGLVIARKHKDTKKGVAKFTECEKVMLGTLPAESSEPLLKSKEPEYLTCSCQESTSNTTSATAGKHKDAKKVLLLLSKLKTVSLDAYERVWKRLDKKPEGTEKGDFRDVAMEFGIVQEDIWELEKEFKTPGSGSPSRHLLECLETRRPELTVLDFIEVLQKPNVDRNDIVTVLNDHIYASTIDE